MLCPFRACFTLLHAASAAFLWREAAVRSRVAAISAGRFLRCWGAACFTRQAAFFASRAAIALRGGLMAACLACLAALQTEFTAIGHTAIAWRIATFRAGDTAWRRGTRSIRRNKSKRQREQGKTSQYIIHHGNFSRIKSITSDNKNARSNTVRQHTVAE